ncbi:hypothetical protein COLO4_09362 [Corchorus olitorius]|uniref:non-specific serine/threonine protein kinase n=1 Tax=Corchorus olitorius TaxID=93759 RepID=A0A1R3KC98_9ROSI|nr:hypothetical protein COLO4_09362 [Corchorus olitorius]
MNSRRFPCSLFSLQVLFVSHVILGIPLSLSNPGLDMFSICRDPKFECGDISLGYPFSGEGIEHGCGHPDLQLSCDDGAAMLEIKGVRYKVLQVEHHDRTLQIARQDLENSLCNPEPEDSIFDSTLFNIISLIPGYVNVTLLYDCPFPTESYGVLNCSMKGDIYKNVSFEFEGEGMPPGAGDCSDNNVTVPILETSLTGTVLDYQSILKSLNAGFRVQLKDNPECQKCAGTGGTCGFEYVWNQTVCYCRNNTNLLLQECPPPQAPDKE